MKSQITNAAPAWPGRHLAAPLATPAMACCLAVLVLATVVKVAAEDYADSTKVNVLMRVDATGTPLTTATWANGSGGGPQGTADLAIDAGNFAAQWNYPSASPSNYVELRLTLFAATTIATLSHSYTNGSYVPSQYRILGSLTGFGSMTELVPWTAVSGAGPYLDTIASTDVQYLQFEFDGSPVTQYLLVKEIEAYPPASATISVNAGYSLFYQDARRGPITEYAGTWGDAVNRCIDLNIDTYLRAHTTPEHWLIIPLNGLYQLVGGYAGFYHGQAWAGGVKIEVTDSVTTTGATWTEVYAKASNWGSGVTPFGGPFPARFVRINAYETGSNSGALCEYRVFAEPAPCQTCDDVLALVLTAVCDIEVTSFQAWQGAVATVISDALAASNLCSSQAACADAIRTAVLSQTACEAMQSILAP